MLITNFEFVCPRQRFQSEARIERIDGLAMVKDFGEEVENMLADKMEAIKVSAHPSD